MNSSKALIARFVLGASVILLFFSGLAETLLVHSFQKGPTVPQPAKGLTAVYNDHGELHYITQQEQTLQTITIILPFVSFAGIVIGTVLTRREKILS